MHEVRNYLLGIADASQTVAAVVGWVDFENPGHRLTDTIVVALDLIVGPRAADANQRRGRLAHEIFVQQSRTQLPANVVPVAMIALESGTVAWIDQ